MFILWTIGTTILIASVVAQSLTRPRRAKVTRDGVMLRLDYGTAVPAFIVDARAQALND